MSNALAVELLSRIAKPTAVTMLIVVIWVRGIMRKIAMRNVGSATDSMREISITIGVD